MQTAEIHFDFNVFTQETTLLRKLAGGNLLKSLNSPKKYVK